MPEIVLHIQPGFQVPGHPRCFSGTPFAIKVERLLRAKGLPFEVTEVAWAERAARLPALSRSRKLPVLVYDGEPVEDSSVIARFLEERHPTPPLVPADPGLRARCHFLEDWADEVLYWYGVYEALRISPPGIVEAAYFADLSAGQRAAAGDLLRRNGEENLDRQGIGRYPPEHVQEEMRRGFDALCAFLAEAPFLAGPSLSVADCAVFGQLHRRRAGTNPWLTAETDRRPALAAWLERVDGQTAA